MSAQKFWQITHELSSSATPFVVITLISSRGHAPQDPGAKAIVGKEGLLWGTVGGGKVEARAIEKAQEKLSATNSIPELLTWNLQTDIGMTCGGEVSYLFETHFSTFWEIAIFGAGHVAQALVRVLSNLECRVQCIDSRPEWIEKLPKQRNLQTKCVESMASAVEGFSEKTFFLSVTQGHAFDIPVLVEIFRRFPNAPYIGVIGSEAKGSKIRKELLEKGIAPALVEKLHCPIGLPIGKNHPGEIAVSIAAELLKVRDELL